MIAQAWPGKVYKLLTLYDMTNAWLFLFNSFDFIFP